MMAAPTHRPIRKIVLITQFESYFVERDVLPALRERGVEVMAVFDPRRLPPIATWDAWARDGCDAILHMHEVGNHSDSRTISTLARQVGLTVRALSRKKATWSFLPAAFTPPANDLPAVTEHRKAKRDARAQRGADTRRLNEALAPMMPTAMMGSVSVVLLPPAPPMTAPEEPVTHNESEPPMNVAKLPPHQTDELTELRNKVTELEKLHTAKSALAELVALGYMTGIEAADVLFRTRK